MNQGIKGLTLMLRGYCEFQRGRSRIALLAADIALGLFSVAMALYLAMPLLFDLIASFREVSIPERGPAGYIVLVMGSAFVLGATVLYINRSRWGLYLVAVLFSIIMLWVLIEWGAYPIWRPWRILSIAVYAYALTVGCANRRSFV